MRPARVPHHRPARKTRFPSPRETPMTRKSADSPLKVRIGIQPTGWTNDDFPEIGNDTPYQQILDQTKETGFVGGSTGHNYPTHLPSLIWALKHRDLGITSTWVGTKF